MAVKLIGGALKGLAKITRKLGKKKKPKKTGKPDVKSKKNSGKKKSKTSASKQTAARNAKVKEKTAGFKSKISKMMGPGLIGGMLGKMMSGADDAEKAAKETPEIAQPQPQQTATETKTGDDPFIDISAAAAGFAAAIQAAISVNREPNEERAISASSIVVVEDIQLDEEGGYPFIESGTLIPARIAEIGTLFSITDRLSGRMDDVHKRVFILDSTLKQLAKQLRDAIDANAATARANERRRDEEDIEEKKSPIKSAVIGAAAIVGLAAAAKISAIAIRTLKVATLGGIAMFADDVAAMMEEEEVPEVDEEAEAIVEQQMDDLDEADDEKILAAQEIAEETPSMIDSAIETYEKYFEDDVVAGSLGTAAMIASGAGLLAAGTAAAPVLAVAGAISGAAALGYGVGNMIADNTQIDEKIGEAIDYIVGNETIEDVATDQEMNEKFGDKRGAALLGDLLGEGMFDMAEEPREIIAAFKDIDTQKKLWALEDDYEQLYGRTLDEALLDVVGAKGLESIDNFVTTNIINKKKLEKATGAVEETKNIITSVMAGDFSGATQQFVEGEISTILLPEMPEEIAGMPVEEIVGDMQRVIQGDIENVIMDKISPPVFEAVNNIEQKIEGVVEDTLGDEGAKIIPIVMNRIKKDPRFSMPTGTTPKPHLDSAQPTFSAIDPFLSRSNIT
jgi:hypothetical protein